MVIICGSFSFGIVPGKVVIRLPRRKALSQKRLMVTFDMQDTSTSERLYSYVSRRDTGSCPSRFIVLSIPIRNIMMPSEEEDGYSDSTVLLSVKQVLDEFVSRTNQISFGELEVYHYHA